MISSKISADITPPSDRWVLTQPVIYVNDDHPERRVTAGVGFYTDFITIPWFALPFFSRTGIAAAAAVIHDAIYSGQAEFSGALRLKYPLGVSRKQADRLLRKTAIELGETRLRAEIIYAGVRMWGWYRWYAYRKARG